MSSQRIVSLLPAATEIVCALGLRSRLMGISHECDFPADVRGLPVLTASSVDPEAPGEVIDRQVRQRIAEALPLYRVHDALLAEIEPDLIVTQDQCEVCALPRTELEAACARAGLEGARVVSLRARGLYDLPRDFRRIAEAAGVPEAGDALASEFTRRLAAVKARAAALPRPRAALVEWLTPPMIAGGWMPELARIAGGEPLFVTREGDFETITWDKIAEAAPDVVVLMPCGFSPERTRRELETGALARSVRALPSTPAGRTFIVDGNAHFNRPGPRLAESAEHLAALLRAREIRAERWT